MFKISPLSRGTFVLVSMLLSLLALQVPGHAQEVATPCKGLRAKELVLCWKKMDPTRARGDHDTFHRDQSAVHLKWHQEHRNMTDAQVTIDHQKLHKDTVRKHQEFHRGAKERQGEMKEEEKKLVTPAVQRDAKTAPNRGRSMRRQLRPRT